LYQIVSIETNIFYLKVEENRYSKSIVPFFIMITLLYILGIARYITDFEENTCEMTYMFEYPQYVVCRYI